MCAIDGPHVIHHPREVDRDLADVDAEPMPVAGARGDARGGQERLGRDAAGPQAVTTGAVAFHQEDPGAQTAQRSSAPTIPAVPPPTTRRSHGPSREPTGDGVAVDWPTLTRCPRH